MNLTPFLCAALALVLWPQGPSRQPAAPRELVVCGWDEVFILNLDAGTGGPPRRSWTWRAKGRPDLPEEIQSLFRTTDDCKPIDGGSKILITSSGGGVALVERARGRVLFYGRAANAHSADLLPGGKIAVAVSQHQAGNRLILFDAAESDRELWSDELPHGHGVVWDAQRQVLWALADQDIRVYERRDWDSARPTLQRVAVIPLPEGGGHELSPVSGTGLLNVSTATKCWLFDRDARTFKPHPELAARRGIKSISHDQVQGQTAYVQAEGKDWWAERIHFLNPSGTLHVPGEHFYKARWNTAVEENAH